MSKRLGNSRKDLKSPAEVKSHFLHRCSFFPYQPTAIKHIAPTPVGCLPQIAVIREAEPTKLEIMTPSSDWAVEKIIYTGAGENFECSVFVGPNTSDMELSDSSEEEDIDISSALKKNFQANTSIYTVDKSKLNAKHFLPRSESSKFPRARLFTAGVDGRLREWSNSAEQGHSIELFSVDVNGGAIWSLAVSPDQSMLAIGCEDGRIRIFSIYERSVEFLRGFEAADVAKNGESARILSLAWDSQGTSLISGSASGSIKLWNPSTGRPIHSISLTNLSIWSVAFCDSQTFVTGDSKGQVQFWDILSGTLLQSFPAFGADVLSLTCLDEKRIFASGVDHKIVEFVKVTAPNAVGHIADKWIIGGKRYFHTHDVKSLTCLTFKYENDESLLERTVLISGGVDCTLVISDPDAFDRALEKTSKNFSAHQRRILPFSRQSPMIQMARDETVLAGLMGNTIQVWKLISGQNPLHLANIKISRFEAIRSFSISPSGSLVSVLTASEFKLFHVNLQSGSIERIETSRLRLTKRATFPHLVVFASEERILAFNSQEIIQLSLDLASLTVQQLQSIKTPCSPCRVTIDSSNCLILSTDRQVFKQTSDQFKMIFESSYVITSVSVLENQNSIIVSDCRNSLIKINGENGKSMDCFDSLPKEWKIRKEPIMGIQAHPTESNKISCWSDSTIAQLSNLDSHANSNKRSSSTSTAKSLECRLIDDYRPILFFSHLNNGDSLVIERPWVQIVESFPPAFYRSRYGAQ